MVNFIMFVLQNVNKDYSVIIMLQEGSAKQMKTNHFSVFCPSKKPSFVLLYNLRTEHSASLQLISNF